MLSAWGCSDKQNDAKNLLARVGPYSLSKQQLEEDMPVGLSREEQAVFTDDYIDNWISSVLLYDVARRNLPDIERLDELAEAYRRDLFIYEYRKRLSDERLAADIPEDTLQQYYGDNSSRFTLHKPLVKGLFLKVPETAPTIASLRRWIAAETPDAVEHIEKYAVKNATGYDYFYDRWVWFDDIKDNIPYEFGDDTRFLQQNKNLEVTHNGVVYLLHISDYRPAGAVMPYEFARSLIVEILLNHRRVQFNRDLEQELLQQAVAAGRVERYYARPTEDSLDTSSEK